MGGQGVPLGPWGRMGAGAWWSDKDRLIQILVSSTTFHNYLFGPRIMKMADYIRQEINLGKIECGKNDLNDNARLIFSTQNKNKEFRIWWLVEGGN